MIDSAGDLQSKDSINLEEEQFSGVDKIFDIVHKNIKGGLKGKGSNTEEQNERRTFKEEFREWVSSFTSFHSTVRLALSKFLLLGRVVAWFYGVRLHLLSHGRSATA